MVEISRPWAGTVTGDAGPYTDDDWSDIWRLLFADNANVVGIAPQILNELEVTGAATPLAVNTGVALVDGTFYWNNASVSVAIPTPGALTRIDRIVVRKDWALQTVRIFRIAGIEGGGVPALVTIDGVTWDLPLYQASTDIGGVITLTDERNRLFIRQPALTTAERDALSAVNGMVIYNETLSQLQGRIAGAWLSFLTATFTELASAAHNVAVIGVWENWDVSALVPAGTTYVLLVMEQITVANVANGARNNGSALNRRYNMHANGTTVLVTPVDSARILEVYDGNAAAGCNFYIAGYWA